MQLSLEEKKDKIQYYASYTDKYYNSKETKELFDDLEFWEYLSKNSVYNNMRQLLKYFDFSAIFSDINSEMSPTQKYILSFLIEKNVDGIESITNALPPNVKKDFAVELYKKSKEKKWMYGHILRAFGSKETCMDLIGEVNNDEIVKAIEILYQDGKDFLLKDLIDSEKKFSDVFVNMVNPPFFYEMVDELNLSENYLKKREKFCKQILENCENYNSNIIKNIFCDYAFHEKYENIMLDLKTIFNSLSLKETGDIASPYASLYSCYNFFNEFENLSIEEIKEFIQNFSRDTEALNRAYAMCSEEFKQSISNAINIPISDEIDTRCFCSSNGQKVLTYIFENKSLNESEICMLISSIPCKTTSKDFVKTYFSKNNGEFRYNRRSTSLINQQSSNKIFGSRNRVILGYLDLKDRIITSATLSDGQTDGNESRFRRKRKTRMARFISPQEFIENTYSHNEISVEKKGDYIPMTPSYVLVVNREPNQTEIDIAAEFGIPIRNVYPERYLGKENHTKTRLSAEEQYEYFSFSRNQIKPKEKTLSMEKIVSNAIIQGISTGKVQEADRVEHIKTQENQIEGETIDDH